MSTAQIIWNKLINAGMTKQGAAGLIGNLYAESNLNPMNVQNSYEKSLGYTDETYTAAVDSGKYTNFVRDEAGYGLAQWTFWNRKQALLNFAKSKNSSIGDLTMQLDFLLQELKSDYSAVWTCLCSTSSVKTASDIVITQFERPADTSESAKNKRTEYSQKYYHQLTNASTSGNKSVSELAQEVLENKWGTGEERKARLTAAGYDYQTIQKAVNELLNSSVEKSVEKKMIDVIISMDGKTYSGVLIEK